ncbi:protein kinase [Methanogenium sp. MK-MG]|uniref:protein kinase domain-containing protein n=1 Tax=Methanogenium sp. MK-MG TaxID=2599926 RepID=UPI0013EAAEC9|nr:protein kinase [Methanogenium sp. MK-MG]
MTLFAVLLLLLAGMICTTAGAATLSVGEDGYATISGALAVAMPGDTILVESGTYYEQLNISVPVTITGVDTGGGFPVIVATDGEAAIVLEAGRTIIEKLVITGTSPCGIFVHSDGNVIMGNTISPTLPETGIGICIYDADRTLVTGNHIEGPHLGLLITESDGTGVYYNDIDAVTGAISSSPETSWVSPVISYEYGGTSFEGILGNHWIEYTGTDTNGDGIGDGSYSLSLTPNGVFRKSNEGKEPDPFERRAFDLIGGVAGIVTVEDDAPLVAGIDAYTIMVPWDVQGNLLKPGELLRPDGTVGHFAIPWEPKKMLWPGIAFLGSLLVAGVLTVADRRARHRSVLNRSGHTTPVLTAGYTILAVLCSSAMFLTGFQSVLIFGNLGSSTPIVGGLAFLSVGGIILAATTATERSPRYLLGAYLIAGGIVAFTSMGLVITGTGGPVGYIPTLLSLTAILVGFYHRSRLVPPQVPEDTDERTRIAHEGDPFDETRIMDTQLRDVYFPATLADRYRDVTFIGKGGLARVFRAVRRSDGAVVAVKVPISFDETTGRIFLKEMKLWEGLVHPNIVRLCSVNILPVPYVEMEYVSRSLADVSLPLPPTEAAVIVEDIVRGLACAHDHGIIHRDIKPHNILLAEDGTAKITDWGLGTMMGDGHESSIVGFSVQYAAPEQIAPRRFGDADTRTDIYQTGIVFYELLTGRRPFDDGGLGEMTDAILGETPALPSSRAPAAAPWDKIVMRCIAKEKEARYPSAVALEEALFTVLKRQ